MILLAVILGATLPVLKDGACPPAYSSSNAYCVPQRGAAPAIPKFGACPPGYTSSGKYCVGRPER